MYLVEIYYLIYFLVFVKFRQKLFCCNQIKVGIHDIVSNFGRIGLDSHVRSCGQKCAKVM